jgi:Ca2+-binding EF-hand superfamily protein
MAASRPICVFLASLLALGASDLRAQDTPADYLRQMDRNGDGRVDEAEYVEYMSAGFRHMDTNGDGILEPNELPGGHGHAITLKAWQNNLRRQFHQLDRNHDGYLNAKELAQPPM